LLCRAPILITGRRGSFTRITEELYAPADCLVSRLGNAESHANGSAGAAFALDAFYRRHHMGRAVVLFQPSQRSVHEAGGRYAEAQSVSILDAARPAVVS